MHPVDEFLFWNNEETYSGEEEAENCHDLIAPGLLHSLRDKRSENAGHDEPGRRHGSKDAKDKLFASSGRVGLAEDSKTVGKYKTGTDALKSTTGDEEGRRLWVDTKAGKQAPQAVLCKSNHIHPFVAIEVTQEAGYKDESADG